MSRPIPDALVRKGLARLTDNLAEGEELPVAGSLIMAFFSEEILAELKRRQAIKDATTKTSANA